jgi:hypothetical protein
VARNRQQQRQRDQKRRLVKLAKSLVSKLEKASSPVRWDQSTLLLANNNLARGQVLAFPKVSSSEPSLLVSCQQHSSGVAPGADL